MLKKLWQWLRGYDVYLDDHGYFMDKEQDVYFAQRGMDDAQVMYVIGGSHVATDCPLARRRRLRECTKMVYLKEGGIS